MLKSGVIGFGTVGETLTKTMHKSYSDVRIVAACDREPKQLGIALAIQESSLEKRVARMSDVC